MSKQRLFIIDAMALAFRSFFAMGRSALTTVEGTPTGAIYATAMFLNKLITEQRPDYLAIVADSDKPTFRHEIYAPYKATRDKMPDELSQQLPFIFELFSCFKAPAIRISGVEADDVIGSMACRYAGSDLDAYIVSGDKDFMQLVNEHIFLYAPKKNEEALIVDRAGVKDKFGVNPEQVIDALALIGDTSDNVPGVSGIGEKGAAKLLAAYGSLEGIYAHLDEISGKRQRESLASNRDQAYLSRRLVTLKTDVALPGDLESLRCPPDAAANPELQDFYQRFEFRVLANKVAAALKKQPAPTDMVPTAASSTQKAPSSDITVIDSAKAALALKANLMLADDGQRSFAIAIQASGWDIIADRAERLGLTTDTGLTYSIEINSETAPIISELLASDHHTKISHGLKFNLQMLHNAGITLQGPWVDLKICDYLIDPNNYNHELDGLCTKYQIPPPPLTMSPAAASMLIHRLASSILPIITRLALDRVLYEVEMPLVPVLSAMEREGVYVDPELLDRYSTELDSMAKQLERDLYKAAGGEFNINSPKQLQDVLFARLKLQEKAGMKRLKKTKTGFSTDESVLTKLAEHHPVPRLILDYRTVTKIKNTYVDALPQFINPKTGRIHTTLSQTVAATGRLSCDRPNLQNIPMRTDLGRHIRAAFKPQKPQHMIISADYSQVELRLLAHLAKAEGLIAAFRAGLDIHTVTAAKIFNLSPDKVDAVSRSRAKAVNFGIIYGMGPQRLAAETGVTLSEAKEFISRYFEAYPGIKHYTESLIEQARTQGYTVTIMGRRRPIPDIRETNRAVQARAENIAVNAPIQGSAADLIKLAMIRIHHEIMKRKLPLTMLLQVHDELVFCCPDDAVEDSVPLIREAMEHAVETSVPLKVDIRSGRTWLEAH